MVHRIRNIRSPIIHLAVLVMLTAGCSPQRRETPRTLLFSPISPEYLRDTAAHWKRTGFDGFLLDRIMDNWSDDVWASDGDAATRGGDDDTFKKVKSCNDACKEQGIEDNFIKVAFYSHIPLWTDDAAWERVCGLFKETARFARMSGCRGIALDIEYVSEQYDPEWKGYAESGAPETDLRKAAVRRGKEIVASMLEAYPEMVFLTLPEGISYYGPLAGDFFRGMVEGMAERGAKGGLHLLTESSYSMTSVMGILHFVQELDSKVNALLDPETASYWKSRCSIAPGGWPLGYYREVIDSSGKFLGYSGREEVFGDSIAGSYADKSRRFSQEEFREQYAGLFLGGKRYCWIYGHGATWWQFSGQDIAKYGRVSNSELPVDAELGKFKDIVRLKYRSTKHIRELGSRIRKGDVDAYLEAMDFVRFYHVSGPFGSRENDNFNTVFPPERTMDASRSSESDGEAEWISVSSDPASGYLDLTRFFSPKDWVCAYAYVSVFAPHPVDAQIRVGTNDAGALWFNREKILSRNIERTAVIDNDIVPVRLREGENTILVKVCNTERNWGLYLRITDREGEPVPGLEYKPVPGKEERSFQSGYPGDLVPSAQDRLDDLRLGVYVTVGSVIDLEGEEARRKAVSVLKGLGITKVYLETYRSGRIADRDLLKDLREFFQSNGFGTAGGIATTPGDTVGVHQEGLLSWFNYQQEKTQRDLEKVVRFSAGLFDEVIIDDFLCTADTSVISKNAKGDRSWPEYRTDLLSGLAEKLIILPAREVNPGVTLVIKYPQWYDRFHMFGYDVVREPPLFDRVWVGTETRGRHTRRMGFVQPYEGYVNFSWISACAPGKTGGAWFDHIDCDADDFMTQAYMSVLAGAREIILFHFGDLIEGHPAHPLFRRNFTRLADLAAMVRNGISKGVFAYKPPSSDADSDHYIFDCLGMLGIPLLPVPEFPSGANAVFLPTQAAKDPMLFEKVKAYAASGGTVILTPGLLLKSAEGEELSALAGVERPEKGDPVNASGLSVDGTFYSFPVQAAVSHVTLKDAEPLINARLESVDLPFLTLRKLETGGRIFFFNARTYSEADFRAIQEVLLAPVPVTWTGMPEPAVNKMRDAFLENSGFAFDAPSSVSLHAYQNGNWVIFNFNDHPVTIHLTPDTANQKTEEEAMEDDRGVRYKIEKGTVTATVERRNCLWLWER